MNSVIWPTLVRNGLFARDGAGYHFAVVVDPISHFGWIRSIDVQVGHGSSVIMDVGKTSIGIRLGEVHPQSFWWTLVEFIYHRNPGLCPQSAEVYSRLEQELVAARNRHLFSYVHSR